MEVVSESSIAIIADRIYYEIVSFCNLQCIHCSDMQSKIPFTEIDAKLLYQFHEKISKVSNIKSVVITGGEPALHSEFYSIVEYFLMKKMNVLITTNGLLLALERIDVLLKKYSNLRLQISVDGITRDVYESIRGKDTWCKLYNVLEHFSNTRWSNQIGLSMTILTQNLNQVLDAVTFAEKLGFGFIHYPVLLCTGAAKKKWKDIAPIVEEQIEVERKLFNLIANSSGKMQISSNRLEQIIVAVLSQGNSHCGKVVTLKVSSNGSLYLCPAACDKSIGNIREEEIVDTLLNKVLNLSFCEPIYREDCKFCRVYELCKSYFCANCNMMTSISEESFDYTCQIVKTHLQDALNELHSVDCEEEKV